MICCLSLTAVILIAAGAGALVIWTGVFTDFELKYSGKSRLRKKLSYKSYISSMYVVIWQITPIPDGTEMFDDLLLLENVLTKYRLLF